MTTITATYSPEDNKLRLYASSRLDSETYSRVKEAGFRWAPRQELFVAPSWSPAREDLCLELAGEIEAEGTTLAERAQAKAGRLDDLAEKRARQASAFHAAADRIGERFYMGQPILVGHHSERRARKDQARMHALADNAVKAAKAVGYWRYRAEGVEAHANYKNDPRTVARRVKTLLSELRDLQRKLNHAYHVLTLWDGLAAKRDQISPEHFAEAVKALAGAHFKEGGTVGYGTWSQLDRGELSAEQVLQMGIDGAEATLNSHTLGRWIQHTLNRLAYERSQLSEVALFEGGITPAMLQIFAREQGADKPKATRDGGGYTLAVDAPLPAHLGDGLRLTLDEAGWRQLMQQCGHVPAAASDKPKSLKQSLAMLNFRAASITAANPYRYRENVEYPQVSMTKAQYAAVNKDYKGTRVSACGTFKFRTLYRMAKLQAVFLTDSKAHPVPESTAVRSEITGSEPVQEAAA